MLVRPEKLLVLASLIGGFADDRLAIGRHVHEGIVGQDRVPCFTALSVQGPVWACMSTAARRMGQEADVTHHISPLRVLITGGLARHP